MSLLRFRVASIAGLLLVQTVVASTAFAQSQAGATRSLRAQLVEQLRAADSLGRSEEAFVLRARLRDGDFAVGDRIDVSFEGGALPKKTDSLIVETGRVVRLGDAMGDLSVAGLLRSELQDSVRGRVDRYYKNVVVHVTPRLRLAVTGAVRTPGFFYARSDMPLSDVITKSGGQDQTSDLRNVVIKRGNQIRWGKEDVQTALIDGTTVEGLALEAGDEIVVGQRTQSQKTLWIQIGISVLTAIAIPLLLRR